MASEVRYVTEKFLDQRVRRAVHSMFTDGRFDPITGGWFQRMVEYQAQWFLPYADSCNYGRAVHRVGRKIIDSYLGKRLDRMEAEILLLRQALEVADK